jgi:hypothetical protein
MKTIRLSGRETAVLRAIGYSLSVPGSGLLEQTQIQFHELVDIINGLMEVGYVQTEPPMDRVTVENFEDTLIEINPSYAKELKEATKRS